MDMTTILLIIIGLVVGAGLGWLLGNREAIGAKRTTEALRLQLDGVTSERDEAREEASSCRSRNEELALEKTRIEKDVESYEKQINALKDAREELLVQFKATGGELLSKVQEDFLKAASERFGHAEKASEEKIKTLLAPVGEEFQKLTKKVEEFDAARLKDFGNIAGLMRAMQEGQEAVRAEAAQLVSSLRNAPKTRGQWGEQQLRNVLDQCGLSEHTDFEREKSVETSDGRLRPDAIIRIPGDKELVVDAKVSLNAYQDAFSAESEEQRRNLLLQHAKAMRSHMQTLASRNYQAQFAKSPDYVVMFVPGEHFLSAALDADGKLWDDAFKQKVLLATPTNLVVIARTIASVWQQQRMSENAEEIAKIARLLFESMSKVTGDFHRMGRQLGLVVKNYNEFGKTLEGHLASRARRLSERYIDVGNKELTAVEYVEEEPRFLASGASNLSDNELGAGVGSTKVSETPLVESAPRYTGNEVEKPVPIKLVEGNRQAGAGENG